MASLGVILKLAIATLLESKLRSILTLIGMVFGTAAVIATLSSNDGAKKYIAKQLESLGTKLMTVNSNIDVSADHIEIIKSYIEDIDEIVKEQQVGEGAFRFGVKQSSGSVIGVDETYFKALTFRIKEGRSFSDVEYDESDLVAVIGANTRSSLFGPSRSAVGESFVLKIGEVATVIRVIGVLAEKGGSHAKLDNSIFVTPKLAYKIVPSLPPAQIMILLKNDDKSGEVKRRMTALLSPKYGDSVTISDAREAIERTKSIWSKQNFVGICLAIVSLLTGGVGIMNIMLLSIHQRQKEIGLRKAVGARNSEIAIQFLFETILICLMGGMLGVMVGWGFGQQVARMLGEWEAETSMITVSMALGFSVLTGIIFGLIPAMRASRIDPYDALRTG